MYQQERLDKILDILKLNRYVTVKYLIERLHYSTATINRDLNILESQNLVKRMHGAVELNNGDKSIPLKFRYHKMRAVKIALAKKAAELIEDGDTVFIDQSTTAQFIGQFLPEKKDITVITNNLSLIIYLSEHGVNVICLGGRVTENPYMLGGDDTVAAIGNHYAGKMFFSTAGVTSDGRILTGDMYHPIYREFLRHSKEAYFLVDHEKLGNLSDNRVLGDLSCVKGVISDIDFDKSVTEKFPQTEFIRIP